MTCWRRLRDWQLASVWDLTHFGLLDWLARGGFIDRLRAIVDSCSVRAVYGGPQTGPDPTDRAKQGSKRHPTRGIVPLLARRRTAHGSGLGHRRWVIEPTFAWLNEFRRLRVRYDKRAEIHEHSFRSAVRGSGGGLCGSDC